jgi:hypothetical protein
MQLLGQGVLGEYLGRLSEQSKGRPLFLIERVERFEKGARRSSADGALAA